jgi:uncharacterized membrane protein YfcA
MKSSSRATLISFLYGFASSGFGGGSAFLGLPFVDILLGSPFSLAALLVAFFFFFLRSAGGCNPSISTCSIIAVAFAVP